MHLSIEKYGDWFNVWHNPVAGVYNKSVHKTAKEVVLKVGSILEVTTFVEPSQNSEASESCQLPTTQVKTPAAPTPKGEIIRLLNMISEDERTDIFSNYCKECGSSNPRCQCWNDE